MFLPVRPGPALVLQGHQPCSVAVAGPGCMAVTATRRRPESPGAGGLPAPATRAWGQSVKDPRMRSGGCLDRCLLSAGRPAAGRLGCSTFTLVSSCCYVRHRPLYVAAGTRLARVPCDSHAPSTPTTPPGAYRSIYPCPDIIGVSCGMTRSLADLWWWLIMFLSFVISPVITS